MSELDERERPPVDTEPAEVDGRPDAAWSGDAEPTPYEPPPPAPPFSWPVAPAETAPAEHEFHHPLDRVTGRLPRRARIIVDWVLTIVGAIAIVLAIKAWVVNPHRIPSSSSVTADRRQCTPRYARIASPTSTAAMIHIVRDHPSTTGEMAMNPPSAPHIQIQNASPSNTMNGFMVIARPMTIGVTNWPSTVLMAR